jgi:hypothetical protein
MSSQFSELDCSRPDIVGMMHHNCLLSFSAHQLEEQRPALHSLSGLQQCMVSPPF